MTKLPYDMIREMALCEQSHYRLQTFSSGGLSDCDLLTLLLDSAETPTLAHSLLLHFGSLHNLARASKWQLLRLPNVDEVQAARILALLALSQRLQQPATNEQTTLSSPADAAKIVVPAMRYLDQEELHVVLLDTRNRVLGIKMIYRGSLHSSIIRIGEVFRPAIEAPAASIIVAHNHPSGVTSPSAEDIHVTKEVCKAGKLLNIKVLDHLIVGDGTHTSLRERLSCFD